jgi:hypothetical protein
MIKDQISSLCKDTWLMLQVPLAESERKGMEWAMPAFNNAMSANPDGPMNLALSDLALNAAIELERFQAIQNGRLDAVEKLSKALSENGLTDLSLVPVYDRALAGDGGAGAISKSDLYTRLQRVASQLQSTETASARDLGLLRDFCVALHDALLTSRLQSSHQSVLGQRRIS